MKERYNESERLIAVEVELKNFRQQMFSEIGEVKTELRHISAILTSENIVFRKEFERRIGELQAKNKEQDNSVETLKDKVYKYAAGGGGFGIAAGLIALLAKFLGF